jgi:hypothetical protein
LIEYLSTLQGRYAGNRGKYLTSYGANFSAACCCVDGPQCASCIIEIVKANDAAALANFRVIAR